MVIRTVARLIECLTLQKENLDTYSAAVGATAADVTQVNQHLAVVTGIIAHCETYDANKKAAFGIKDTIINGPADESVAEIPTTAPYVHPVGTEADIMGIRNSKNRVFEEGPGYNNDIGIALGIVVPSPLAPEPGTVQPTLTAEGAQNGGFAFAYIIGNRAKSDFWRLYTAPVGSTNWTEAASGTGKAGEVTVIPTTPGQPMQLQVRVLLFKNNEVYGVYSAVVYVTVTP